MLKLDLDREELEVLVDLLETGLADLRMELGLTSNLPRRELLRKRKKVLEKTVVRLRQETDGTHLFMDRVKPLD